MILTYGRDMIAASFNTLLLLFYVILFMKFLSKIKKIGLDLVVY